MGLYWKIPGGLRQALPLVGGREVRGVQQRLGAPFVGERHAREIAHELARTALDVILVHARLVRPGQVDLCARRAWQRRAARTRPVPM